MSDKISNREKQVLSLIANEYSTKEIAEHLYISEHTAHSHRKNLRVKLGVKNAAGLVRRAFEEGYLLLNPFEPVNQTLVYLNP